jgi:hypothetical protein
MEKIKAYLKLVEYFGFINAVKLVWMFRSGNWSIYNWWLYNRTIQGEPLPESINSWEPQYKWHVPNKTDFNEIKEFMKFIKEYGNGT